MGVISAIGLAAMDALALERRDDGKLVATGALPSWCASLWRDGQPFDFRVPFTGEDVFPFLMAFLPEAEDAWRGYGRTRADSEFWTEKDREGREIHLEATAVRAGDARLLVILRNERLFVKEQTFLQRARELRLTHDALSSELEQKDILVHAIVHDLAAPLHSIIGILSLLGESEKEQPASQWIELARQAATRQRDLIAEILDVFAGPATSGSSSRQVEVGTDLTAVVERVVAEREPVSRMKDVRLKLSGNAASARVVGDEARLFRVLTNLVDNAVRYSPSGTVVSIELVTECDHVCVFVDDEGPGVAPATIPRLFQKFARGPDASAGTGLGLFYCRITLEDWGGGIGYEPRRGGGARFWARLRRTDDGKATPAR